MPIPLVPDSVPQIKMPAPREHSLLVLLGGEAGLRCGEMMALEWADIDLDKRQLCVARSEWKGHVTMPKGGRLRYVPLTRRLAEALRGSVTYAARGCCAWRWQPLTQKVVRCW